MSTLFISDLHLDESRPAVTRAFIDWLQTTAATAHALYILGDFFESWVGDDNHSALIDQVARALQQYTTQTAPVYLMHGNRDFLIGQAFCQQTGCQLIDDPYSVTLYQRPTLLMHGDTLCTGDTDYLAFRAMVRNPQWQQQLLAKPLTERLALAKQLRSASMQANSNKAEDIMDVTEDQVHMVMQQFHCQLLIHGHTHRPAIHDLGEGRVRIVLGDWHQQGWYLHMHNDGSYALEQFIIS